VFAPIFGCQARLHRIQKRANTRFAPTLDVLWERQHIHPFTNPTLPLKGREFLPHDYQNR
jgi:hypothetical protein